MRDPTTKRRSKSAVMKEALQQCAAPFVINPASSDEIDWEGMAREFYRRMTVAKGALENGT